MTAACQAEAAKPVYTDAANRAAKSAIFGMIGSVNLKKTKTVEKTMFAKHEGGLKNAKAKDAAEPKDGRKALSKLIDFPGDVEAIRKHLANKDAIDPAGNDAYGLAAIHKFASWNKVELLQMLLPNLTADEINARDPEGKTALHWAVEMASVGSVKVLRKAGIDVSAKNAKGHTVSDILSAVPMSGVIRRLKESLAI